MKKITIVLFTPLLILGCGQKTSMETVVKKYMTDSVVVNFNDPKSYEFVSLAKPDSVFSHDIAKKNIEDLTIQLGGKQSELRLAKIQTDMDKTESTGSAIDKDIDNGNQKVEASVNKQIDLLNESINVYKKQLAEKDFLDHIDFQVNCRAKNKMGALILNTVELRYYPKDNKFEQIPE